MRLNELTSGKICFVNKIHTEPKLKRRLYELGFVPNAMIEIINVSPMAKAFLLKIQESIFAIRGEIAQKIEVDVNDYSLSLSS